MALYSFQLLFKYRRLGNILLFCILRGENYRIEIFCHLFQYCLKINSHACIIDTVWHTDRNIMAISSRVTNLIVLNFGIFNFLSAIFKYFLNKCETFMYSNFVWSRLKQISQFETRRSSNLCFLFLFLSLFFFKYAIT